MKEVISSPSIIYHRLVKLRSHPRIEICDLTTLSHSSTTTKITKALSHKLDKMRNAIKCVVKQILDHIVVPGKLKLRIKIERGRYARRGGVGNM